VSNVYRYQLWWTQITFQCSLSVSKIESLLLVYLVAGTPLQFVVDAVDKGYVTAYGQGLSLGLSGKECTFHVVGPSSKYTT